MRRDGEHEAELPLIEASSWSLPKSGSRDSEDAFAHRGPRVAVADGASTSVHAASWSALLTERFIDDPVDPLDPTAFGRWIERSCRAFAERLVAPSEPIDADNWIEHAASHRHGHAAFAGIVFDLDGDVQTCRWVGVGDVCVFHVRDRRLHNVAPTSDPNDFGSHPDLITSDPCDRERAVDAAFTGRSVVDPGDTIMVCTDALGQWILSSADEDRWTLAADDADLASSVDAARESGEIVDDDVTLVRCEVRA